jgi:YggT family protein
MIIDFIVALLNILALAIIVRSLLSWVDPMGRNPVSQALHVVTEPILSPIRNLMGGGGVGGFDLSPMIALLAIWGVSGALVAAR